MWNLQFIYCKPNAEGEYNDHDLFGDGLIWSACPATATHGAQAASTHSACKRIRKLRLASFGPTWAGSGAQSCTC